MSLFDDLIPASAPASASSGSGLFDDLIPQAPQAAPRTRRGLAPDLVEQRSRQGVPDLGAAAAAVSQAAAPVVEASRAANERRENDAATAFADERDETMAGMRERLDDPDLDPDTRAFIERNLRDMEEGQNELRGVNERERQRQEALDRARLLTGTAMRVERMQREGRTGQDPRVEEPADGYFERQWQERRAEAMTPSWRNDLKAGVLMARQGLAVLGQTGAISRLNPVDSPEAESAYTGTAGDPDRRLARLDVEIAEAAQEAGQRGEGRQEAAERLARLRAERQQVMLQMGRNNDPNPERAARQRAEDVASVTAAAERVGELGEQAARLPTDWRADQVMAADSFGNAIEAFLDAPGPTTRQTLLRSLPAMTPAALAAVGGQLAGGPVGAGAAAGSVGALTEYALSVSDGLSEALRERDIDPTDEDAVTAALEGDPELLNGILQSAAARAGIIGVTDAATAGIAGRAVQVPLNASRRERVARLGLGSAIETGGEMTGEAGAQLATEGEIRPGEVLAEGIAGAGMSIPQTVGQMGAEALRRESRPSRLTPSDRASPIPDDIIEQGKAVLAGEPPERSPTRAPAEPQAGVAPLPGIPETPTPRAEPSRVGAGVPVAPVRPQAPEAGTAPEQPDGERYEVLPEVATIDGETRETGRQIRLDRETGTVEVIEDTPQETADAETTPADAGNVVGGGGPVAGVEGDNAGRGGQPAVAPAEPATGDARGADRGAAAQDAPRADGDSDSAAVAPGETRPVRRRILDDATTRRIQTDASAFQYKGGGDAEGVTERLRGVERFNPNRAGQAILFERTDGTLVVADGHQRTGLARRAAAAGQADVGGMTGVIYREADGWTPEEVMVEAALKNIGEGSGTAIDAARIFRDQPGRSLADMDLPPQADSVARRGMELSALSDDAFGMVATGMASERDGGIVGRVVSDQAAQADILGLLTRLSPPNQFQAEAIARQAAAETVTETQDSLFGPEEVQRSLYAERAKVLDNAMKRLRKDRATFKTLTERGEAITSAGNRLDNDANAARLSGDEAAMQFLASQANAKGPISDALTEAAQALARGDGLGAVSGQFVEAVRNAARDLFGGGEARGGRREAGPPAQEGGRRDGGARPNDADEAVGAAEGDAGDVDDGPGLFDADAAFVEPYGDRSIIVRGVPREAREAFAGVGVRPIWNRGSGGWVFPARAERKVTAALADQGDLFGGGEIGRDASRDRAEIDARQRQSRMRRGDQTRVENDEDTLFGRGAQGDLRPLPERRDPDALWQAAREGMRAALRPYRREGDQNPENARPVPVPDEKDLIVALDAAEEMQDKAAAADAWVRAMGDKTGREHIVLLDKDGALIALREGDSNSVGIPPAVLRYVADKGLGHATHNHPRSSPHSPADVMMVMAGWNPLTVVRPDGGTFVARPGPNALALSTDMSTLETRGRWAIAGGALRDLHAMAGARGNEMWEQGGYRDEAADGASVSALFTLYLQDLGVIEVSGDVEGVVAKTGVEYDRAAHAGLIDRAASDLRRAGFPIPARGDRGGDQARGETAGEERGGPGDDRGAAQGASGDGSEGDGRRRVRPRRVRPRGTDPRIQYQEGEGEPDPAEIARVMPELRRALDAAGLKRVRLSVDAEADGWQGAFVRDGIGPGEIVIGASLDPQATLHHEVIHALRAMNAFTEAEWAALHKAAADEWLDKHDILARYPDLAPFEQIEEAIAEEFGAWASSNAKPRGMAQMALAKIRKVLDAIRAALIGQGFNTPEDVFGRIVSGRVAERGAEQSVTMAPDPVYQFAGPQSETADLHSLARARDMIEGGASPASVRRETGWFRGPDGKWRYEISDDKASLNMARIPPLGNRAADYVDWQENNAGRLTTLANILNHDALYAAYPDLARVPVYFDRMMDANGSVSGFGSSMSLNPLALDTPEAMLSTVLHEVQHLIQAREGFARGGNLTMTSNVKTALKMLAVGRQKEADAERERLASRLSEEEQAMRKLDHVLMWDSFQALIRYSSADRPSGVRRLILQHSDWLHHPLLRNGPDDISDRARDLYYNLGRMPKPHRMAERNRFLSEWSFEMAQLLRDAVPAETWAQFDADTRQPKSVIAAVGRELRKVRKDLLPLDERIQAARKAGRLEDAHRYASPFEIYQALAGEVEARQTQARAGMTDEERAQRPASPFNDIQFDPERIIVVFPDGELETPFIANVEPSSIQFQRPATARTPSGRAATAQQTQTAHIPDRRLWEELAATNRTALERLSGARGALRDRMDQARVVVQDRMLMMRRAEEAIASLTGSEVAKEQSVYYAEERYSGRAGRRLDAIEERFTQPIIQQIAKSDGIALTDPQSGTALTGVDAVSLWLEARHTKERNAHIRKINPNMRDGGAGLTDAEADAVMAEAKRGPSMATLTKIGALTDRLGSEMIDLRVEAGLLSKDEATAWRAAYRHYVPLKGYAETDMYDAVLGNPPGAGGRPFGATGNESRRALGRGRGNRAFDPLTAMLTQAQEVAIRAEKNLVAQTLYRMAQTHPNPVMWEIKKPEQKRFYNSSTGRVETRVVDPLQGQMAPNEMAVKIDGEEHRVVLQDPRLARALGQVGTTGLSDMLKPFAMFARYFSAINTMLSPPFLVVNAFRDMMTAQVNIAAASGKDKNALRGAMLRDWFRAQQGSWKAMKGDTSGKWAQWFREYEEAGARVSFFNIETPEAGSADLRRRVSTARGNAAARAAKTLWRPSTRDNPALAWVERANLSVDNAIRLAAYARARELGWSKEEAASLSKNLTVNFNRRGEIGASLNALWVFFNAAIQGTHVLLKAMKSNEVKALMAGGFVMGLANDLINAMASDDEDDDGLLDYDEIPNFRSERNFILRWGGDATFTIPLPYGYSVFPYAGQQLGKVLRGVKDPGRAMADVAGSLVTNFSPISGQTVMDAVTPTAAQLPMQLSQNEDWLGRPIRPEAAYGDYGPQSFLDYNASAASRAIASGLNTMTGGSTVQPGFIDVSPEYLDHTFAYLTGGLGRFAGRTVDLGVKAVTGDVIEARDIPIARVLITDTGDYLDRSRFFALRDVVEDAAAMQKRSRETGDLLSDRQKAAASLAPLLRSAERRAKPITDRINDIYANDSLSTRQRRLAVEPLQERRADIYQSFTRRFVETVGPVPD